MRNPAVVSGLSRVRGTPTREIELLVARQLPTTLGRPVGSLVKRSSELPELGSNIGMCWRRTLDSMYLNRSRGVAFAKQAPTPAEGMDADDEDRRKRELHWPDAAVGLFRLLIPKVR